MPIQIAPKGVTLPHAGVIATRPATAAVAPPRAVGLPRWSDFEEGPRDDRRDAAVLVFRNARVASGLALSALPALNPNQPGPEESGADHAERQAVRRHRLLAETAALAEHEGEDERRVAARHVDDEPAGEVDGARLEDPALGAPHHVGDRAVDGEEPHRDERAPCAELHALGDRAEDQGGRDDREHRLEHDEDVLGDVARRRREVGRHRVDRHAGESGLREVADEGVAGAEGEAVADEDPEHADDAGGQHALHEDVEDVLRAHQAAVEEGETGKRHHQDERRGRQDPGGVAAVDDRRSGCRLFGEREPAREQGGRGRAERAAQ